MPRRRLIGVRILRADLDATESALETAGFILRHVASVALFLDGSDAKAREAVRVVFASERVGPDDVVPAMGASKSEPAEGFRVLRLGAVARTKLMSFRDNDRTHLRSDSDVSDQAGRNPRDATARVAAGC